MAVTLFDYQQEDVDKLAQVTCGLIASEMGTGKTYEAVALDLVRRELTADDDFPRKSLVVAPLSVLSSWEDHFNELAPHLKTRVVNNKSKKFRDMFLDVEADVYIIHYDVLRLMPELAKVEWLHVIADECHRIQNRKAQQTKALKKIPAYYKTGLSGTPITNKADKFQSVLNWLYPKKYRSYWNFYNKYVDYEIIYPEGYHKIIGSKNEKELHKEIESFYVRHLKLGKCCKRHPNGVQPFLPAKYYSKIAVPLLPPQRKAYDEMKKDMIAWVQEYGSQDDDVLSPLVAPIAISKLIRLQQFSVAHAQVESIHGPAGTTTKVHLSEPSSKLDALMQLLEDNPDQQIVVFSQFKQLINLLARRLKAAEISHVLLTGDVDHSQRGWNIEQFQSGAARVFCGTIAAGGVGVTLTAASTVVFLDRSYSPALNLQAEDRLHRIGQESAVQVIDIVSTNTADREKLNEVDLKWSAIKRLLGDS